VRRFEPDGLTYAAGACLVLAVLGFVLHIAVLAALGAGGVLGAGVVFWWQRHCLDGVTYERRLGRERALFGEQVPLNVRIDNQKLLPLTWLRIEDNLSTELTIVGGTVTTHAETGRFAQLRQLLAVMPFQRVDRQMAVVCDRRGRHGFGPVRLESGDPFGYRQRFVNLAQRAELLVYPKTFALEPPEVVARLALGPARAGPLVMADPSRVVGSRQYQAGDPLRHIDWRATARYRSPLVRIFQPTATPKVAVVLDTRLDDLAARWDLFEFAVALAASVVLDLANRGVAVGLVSTGTAEGQPVAVAPASSPGTAAEILEYLACLSPYGPRDAEALPALVRSVSGPGTSLLLLSVDGHEEVLGALAEARRRRGVPVSALWVGAPKSEPAAAHLDAAAYVEVPDDWRHQDTVAVSR
jgi:uncharacterized protein (DUF58 family)